MATKKFKVIACKVLLRELYLIASQTKATIDVMSMRQELHNTPDLLRSTVQAAIDSCENEDELYDAILLGYGLCSNGVVGLSSKKYPLVVPKGHDCITLLLGSKEKYKEIFDSFDGGIYWYSTGWIESTMQPGKERYETTLAQYTEKYGEDNAQYLMEMEQAWFTNYKAAVYVGWEKLHQPQHWDYTQECAQYLGWKCAAYTGDEGLLQDMLEGEWDSDRFVVLQPGESIKATHDLEVLGAEPPCPNRTTNNSCTV